jgi:hypothetical protein
MKLSHCPSYCVRYLLCEGQGYIVTCDGAERAERMSILCTHDALENSSAYSHSRTLSWYVRYVKKPATLITPYSFTTYHGYPLPGSIPSTMLGPMCALTT